MKRYRQRMQSIKLQTPVWSASNRVVVLCSSLLFPYATQRIEQSKQRNHSRTHRISIRFAMWLRAYEEQQQR